MHDRGGKLNFSNAQKPVQIHHTYFLPSPHLRARAPRRMRVKYVWPARLARRRPEEKPRIQIRQKHYPAFGRSIPGPLLSPPYLSVYPSVYVRMRRTIAERRGPGFEATNTCASHLCSSHSCVLHVIQRLHMECRGFPNKVGCSTHVRPKA